MIGFEVEISYDPALLEVVNVDHQFVLAAVDNDSPLACLPAANIHTVCILITRFYKTNLRYHSASLVSKLPLVLFENRQRQVHLPDAVVRNVVRISLYLWRLTRQSNFGYTGG